MVFRWTEDWMTDSARYLVPGFATMANHDLLTSGAPMETPAASAEALNVEQLLHLHTLTKEVAKVCQKQLRGYLETMALLFRPRRILGDYMERGEKESVGGSDRTLAELRE